MTYHDLNRLTAHLEQLSGLKLTATQLATLKELASSLSANSEAIQLPASYLAKQIGRTPKTTETALRALISLDIVEATQPRPHHARTYKLASWISCPETCQKIKAHNSPARIKRLNLTSNSYPQETAITSKKSSITSNDYRTNRDIDIDDIELQFLRIIETITELLMEAGELTKEQAELNNYLASDPGSITERVKYLADRYKVKHLKTWLETIVSNNPGTLYKHLEQPAKSSRQALKDKKQPATIYSNTAGSSRVSETRLKRYCQEVIGFTLTATSSSYLLKRGTAITWQDLQLAKLFEAMANKPEIKNLNPNNPLRLELIDNQITISYQDLDSVSFNISNLEQDNWSLETAQELSNRLEAERLESELIANLEAQGYNWRTDPTGTWGKALTEIRERYPKITPAEAGRRFTQAVSEQLTKFHKATPETPAEPELYPDLKSWIASNYTQEADYLELREHYPENNSPNAWDEKAGFNKYQEALDNGYTWEQLASSMDHYRNSLGTKYPVAPAKWLNDLPDKRKLKQAKPEARAGEALDIASILDSLNPANKAL